MSNVMVRGGISAGTLFWTYAFLNGSTNVLINGIPVGRMGDGYNSGTHNCGKSSHAIGSASSGFPKFLLTAVLILQNRDVSFVWRQCWIDTSYKSFYWLRIFHYT